MKKKKRRKRFNTGEDSIIYPKTNFYKEKEQTWQGNEFLFILSEIRYNRVRFIRGALYSIIV